MMQLTTGFFFFCLVRLEHGLAKGLTDHGLRLLDITTPGGGWQPGPLSFLSQPFRLPSDHPYFPPTGTGTLQMPAPLQTTYQYHCGTVPYYCNRCQRPSRRHGITLAYAPPLLHHATLVSQGAEWPGQGGELADQIHAWCMHFCFALSFGESSKEKDTLSLFCDEEKGEGAHQGPGL